MKRRRVRPIFYFWMFLFATIIVLVILLITGSFSCNGTTPNTPIDPAITPDADPTPTAQPEPTPFDFNVTGSASSDPSVFGFVSELNVDGTDVTSYDSDEVFNFDIGSNYTELEGVISFRGNNFRNTATYGTASVTQKVIESMWSVRTYSLPKGDGGNYSGAWTGSGWTGQPILVRWPESTKAIMNMYDSAKSKEGLVEVIYATMDGYIYFIDLETGEKTRDPMNIGVPFKGAGSLDPRGIPLLYLGSGDHYNNRDGGAARAMIVSLIDCKILYSFGERPDSYALRQWTAYDSSALVSAENDTLIYPGENGILYVMKLNTQYDEEAGTLSVNPSKVRKLRYYADRTNKTLQDKDGYSLGYEGSAAAFGSYLFLTENSGLIHCVDLNTMKVMWVQDIWDDTNASPVFELTEDGKTYLYIGDTLENKANANGYGPVSFFKIDAATGEIVWQADRDVYTTSGVTGGVMTSAILGENDLSGLVFIVYASYGNGNHGDMVALNTETGEVVWETELLAYAWSSPAAVYDEEGHGYLVQCGYGGHVYLVDGKTGNILHTYTMPNNSNIEASPAIFDDVIVIGTRTEGIWGLRIK